jgi:hypothetical protein
MRPIGLKLAMKIGGEYGLRNIAAKHWQRLAGEAVFDFDLFPDLEQSGQLASSGSNFTKSFFHFTFFGRRLRHYWLARPATRA